jgi:histidine triad (HIT) family protein
MPTLFTQIINREIPGRFIWEDELCVAFLTIAPLSDGHTLIVPREEIDHWILADPALFSHCMGVAQHIGNAIQRSFSPARVVQLIAGFEVPHLHVHVLGAASEADINFSKADPAASGEKLDANSHKLREALIEAGFGDSVPKR